MWKEKKLVCVSDALRIQSNIRFGESESPSIWIEWSGGVVYGTYPLSKLCASSCLSLSLSLTDCVCSDLCDVIECVWVLSVCLCLCLCLCLLFSPKSNRPSNSQPAANTDNKGTSTGTNKRNEKRGGSKGEWRLYGTIERFDGACLIQWKTLNFHQAKRYACRYVVWR